MDIRWSQVDPATGERILTMAEHFAGKWTFRRREGRRGTWEPVAHPTLEMWRHVLDHLERSRSRRLADEKQIAAVRKTVRMMEGEAAAPAVSDEEPAGS